MMMVEKLYALCRVVIGAIFLSGCSGLTHFGHVEPLRGAPVTDNNTPYSECLASLAVLPGDNLPTIAVGDISDKTGQYSPDTYTDSTVLTQGVSEMVISALFKTRKIYLSERLDVRIPLADQKLAELNAFDGAVPKLALRPIDFVILGALTELNYNIVSGGVRLFIDGIGGGERTAVINVGVDLRLIDSRTLNTVYVTSLQKQIVGFEVETGIFSFFGGTLVEFDAGAIRNEPLQVGVRSVVEMAVYQILTEGLGLLQDAECHPSEIQEATTNYHNGE